MGSPRVEKSRLYFIAPLCFTLGQARSVSVNRSLPPSEISWEDDMNLPSQVASQSV